MNEFKDYFADKPEYELLFQDAQEDVIRQQDLVNTVISQGVKILLVVPVDTDSVNPIVESSRKANIPLIFFNRNPFYDSAPPENVYYLGSQPIISGQLQAEFVGKLLNGQGNVCILMGTLGQEAQVKRTEGNEQIIKEKYPNIKILAKDTGKWQRDQGMTMAENWLTAYGTNLNAILANNDELALGAIEALRAAGRTDVIVLGIDGIPDAFAAVKNKSLAATVFLSPALEGRGVADIAYKILNKQSVEKITWTQDVFVTAENVAQYE
jgi:inositol transport system substrate-binding protein